MLDTLFFYASKVIWALVSPDSLILLLLLASFLLMLMKRVQLAKRILGVVVVALTTISFLPVAHTVVFPLESRFPVNPQLPEQVDGIIVLSGGVNARQSSLTGQIQVNEQFERELAMVELMNRYPDAKVIYSGGSSSILNQTYRGADGVKQLIEQFGVATDRVIFERDSRNTYESSINLPQMLNPEPMENWVLITSAFHMPRSVGAFCANNWSVFPYPVDMKTEGEISWRPGLNFAENMVLLKLGTKEWIGLLAYRLTLKTDALFPKGCGNITVPNIEIGSA